MTEKEKKINSKHYLYIVFFNSKHFSHLQWIHLVYEFRETIKAAKHYCCSIITKWHFLENLKTYFFSLWILCLCSVVKLLLIRESFIFEYVLASVEKKIWIFYLTFCSISLFATIGGKSARSSFSLRFCSFVTLDPLIANALINLYSKFEFIRWN